MNAEQELTQIEEKMSSVRDARLRCTAEKEAAEQDVSRSRASHREQFRSCIHFFFGGLPRRLRTTLTLLTSAMCLSFQPKSNANWTD